MGLLHLVVRDAIDDIKGAPQTFSSWDKCMQKAYCKYPVIVAIVVGSLIALSIIFCLVRCLCCGLSCCGSCCSCLDDCCGSRGGRHKPSRHADEPPNRFAPNPYHGYQPTPNGPPLYEPPQYAQFDVSKKGKVDDDALPAMPSWDNATSKKIEDHEAHDDVEMGNMANHSNQNLGAAAVGGPGGRGRYTPVGSDLGSPHPSQYGMQNGSHSMHPYGGDIGNQQARPDYDYGRPSPSPQHSFASGPQSPYNQGYNQSYDRQPTGSHAQAPPAGGFRAPASEDQFQPSAMAPTPNQYNTGSVTHSQAPPLSPQSSYTAVSSTRYEPSSQYTGYDQGHMGHPAASTPTQGDRPPSILQAGRKPVQGSWKDV